MEPTPYANRAADARLPALWIIASSPTPSCGTRVEMTSALKALAYHLGRTVLEETKQGYAIYNGNPTDYLATGIPQP